MILRAEVLNFCALIAEKHKLDAEELIKLWDENEISSKISKIPAPVVAAVAAVRASPPSSSPPVETALETALMAMSKLELREKCASMSLGVSGSKKELVAKILGKQETESKSEPKSEPKSKSTKPSKSRSEKKQTKKDGTSNKVLESIKVDETFIFLPNKHGNFEDASTGFVIDPSSSKVIGRQKANGTVSPLTKEDVQECIRLKLPFDLPLSLDDENEEEGDMAVDAIAGVEVGSEEMLFEEEDEEELIE